MKLRAGQLRHLLKFERNIRTDRNTFGEPVFEWEHVCDAWGMITPLSGREVSEARAQGDRTTHEITTRYAPGIDSRMRVRYGDRLFELTSVRNVEERDRALMLRAIEVNEQG